MKRRAEQLAAYCEDRLGDQLRAVGYYDSDGPELVHVREDLQSQYAPKRLKGFVEGSRDLQTELKRLEEAMGDPQASLHVLSDGLVVQFHFPGETVVFLAMERTVGRNFLTFIDDCQDAMT